ncbi:helix-turn-helix transcriptional regulator [Butyrivibrio sp. VCD2006]|uniref:helix-turn-helix transcriptional regulator n=1 Tax=Butyrivibrio sp. VCD2006 TaxID=1280664 RepID=UPI0003FDF7CC|nr:WYL domain-containing transcriptional regulator [Butyrivibrio sp. VCD2006]
MSLSNSNYLIRDYENIRAILRDIYIYGCFSKDDFVEKLGISSRKYDKEQQRISAYLPENFIQKRRVDKKAVLYCTYHGMEDSRNYLADTYRNKSFTALDIMAFFFVQQLLAETEEMTAGEILEALPSLNDDAVFTKDNLRVKLDELVEKGFITTTKRGRSVKYRLCKDIWEDFSDEELLDIFNYLEFMKNVSPIGMPYFFLQDKLKLYLKSSRDIDSSDYKVFSFKHNHLYNILDNDVLLEILKAKQKKRLLKVTYNNKQKENTIIVGEIIHDSVYGRQYLHCYLLESKRTSVIRIDRIDEASDIGDLDDNEIRIQDGMRNFSDYCWCTSSTESGPSEIVIHFMFDEENEGYIKNRILNEGHGGVLTKIRDGIYEYRLNIGDPDEMIPWIRSFGQRAKVISSGERKTEEKLKDDWKRALEKYDSL